MTEFIFVRHCESEANLQPYIIGGRSNHTPASERGMQQATLLGQYFKSVDLQPSKVYSSGAVRADTTAQLSLEQARIPHTLIIDEDLQELSQGTFEGRDRRGVYTPETIELYDLNSLEGKFPEGESIADAARRMWRFVESVHTNHPSELVLVFGHGLAIRALAGKINNQSKQEILALETPNVSLTKISIDNHTPTVHYVGKNVI